MCVCVCVLEREYVCMYVKCVYVSTYADFNRAAESTEERRGEERREEERRGEKRRGESLYFFHLQIKIHTHTHVSDSPCHHKKTF